MLTNEKNETGKDLENVLKEIKDKQMVILRIEEKRKILEEKKKIKDKIKSEKRNDITIE